MRQFDVFPNPFPRSRERQPFLVNLQSDLLARGLDTVVVAPLERVGAEPFADRLNPVVSFGGSDYALMVQEMVAIRARGVGQPAGSLAEHRDRIIAALDLLFTGI